MLAVFRTSYFLEAQGYQVMGEFFYHDNKSAIIPEKNGKSSISKCTKQINIRLFLIPDCISRKELNVEWCPKNDTIVDFKTKPTQGILFNKFRDLIIGVIPIKKYIKQIKESEI